MIRFVVYALPMLMLMLASFGFVVDFLDLEPRAGSVIRLAFFEQPRAPASVVLGAWTMEACGLLALYLLARGRCGTWWLDGLVAGWLAWVFRGPLLVVTIVVAVRQPQDPWWTLALGWWILYGLCGLALAVLARRSGLDGPSPAPETPPAPETSSAPETTTAPASTTAPETPPAPETTTAPAPAGQEG